MFTYDTVQFRCQTHLGELLPGIFISEICQASQTDLSAESNYGSKAMQCTIRQVDAVYNETKVMQCMMRQR